MIYYVEIFRSGLVWRFPDRAIIWRRGACAPQAKSRSTARASSQQSSRTTNASQSNRPKSPRREPPSLFSDRPLLFTHTHTRRPRRFLRSSTISRFPRRFKRYRLLRVFKIVARLVLRGIEAEFSLKIIFSQPIIYYSSIFSTGQRVYKQFTIPLKKKKNIKAINKFSEKM